jgi:hypothetical protein
MLFSENNLKLQVTNFNPCTRNCFFQPKLNLNSQGDSFEKEADTVAERVMQMPDHAVQNHSFFKPSPGNFSVHNDSGSIKPKQFEAGNSVENYLNIHYQSGSPLPGNVKRFFEPRFGQDLSGVRIHTGRLAEESAESIDALAYTHRNHIVFNHNQFSPDSVVGKKLLAHELTHTLQQNTRINRQPKDKSPGKTETVKTTTPVTLKGLNRTLYVVQNDVWSVLPAKVRTSAIKELDRLFAFVGKVEGEKAFSIKVMAAQQLPEQFDFSESVVSVIEGDPKAYIDQAFELQQKQIETWLKSQKVQPPTTSKSGFAPGKPETLGRGGGSRTIVTDKKQTYALPVMAGAVNKGEVIDAFFDNIDALLEAQLKKLPGKGRDPNKWPSKVTSNDGEIIWDALELLGTAFGRALAHEARHEYVGGGHAESGLGEESPIILDEKNSENFSEDDQKAILKKIQDLEKKQGNAITVPTFPKDIRSQKDLFPF